MQAKGETKFGKHMCVNAKCIGAETHKRWRCPHIKCYACKRLGHTQTHARV